MKKRLFGRSVSFFLCVGLCFLVSVSGMAAGTQNAAQTVSISLTEEEKQYIAQHPSVSIAIDTSWIPYGFSAHDHECGGIIPNVMQMVAERVGLRVDFVQKNTYEDAIKACNTGETMLVSGIADDAQMAQKNNVQITDPYITIGYSAVTKREITDLYAQGANYRVAICVGTYAKMAMQKRLSTYEFVEYHSNEECMNAVLHDKADMALVANYSAGYFNSWHEYGDLQIIQINDFTWGLCFGVNQACDPTLLEILNKGIASLTENDVNQAIYGGAIDASSSTHRLEDVIYDQPALTGVLVGVVVAAAALAIFLFVLRRRKNRELAKERQFKEDIYQKDLLLNSIPTGIGVFEIKDNIAQERYINDSFYRLVEEPRESRKAWTHGNFLEGIIEQDRPLVTAAIQTLMNGNDHTVFTYRALKPNGSFVWIRLIALVTVRGAESTTVYCSLLGVDEDVKNRQALQESADIISAAMRSANMTVWSYDIQTHRITQKEALVDQHRFGKVVEDVPENLIQNGYVHPDSANAYRQAFADIACAKEPIQGDFLVQTADRTGYWWERMILTPVFENGKPIKAIGTSINITARKEKESEYLKLVDKMADMDDENLIAKGRYNLSKNRLLYYDRKANGSLRLSDHDTFDYALDEMVKTAATENDGQMLERMLDRYKLLGEYSAGKTEGSLEYKRYHENQSSFWSLLRYKLFEEPNSGDVIFFVYTYDISERVLENRMLTKLGATEYDVLGLIDVHTHQFESKSVKGIKSLANSSSRYLMGTFEDVVHKQVLETVPEAERSALEHQLDVTVIVDKLQKMDTYYVAFSACRSDHVLRRKVLNFSFLDESKTTLFYYCTDITELYNREQQQLLQTEEALRQARQANESKTEFFSRMSHDMRTPMNGILGMADLSEGEADMEVLKQNIRKIKASGEYLLGLINDTLDFQRIESGKLQLDPQIVNCGDIMHNILDMVKPAIEKKHLDFRVLNRNIILEGDIRADPVRIKQIFVYLISNAMKFTPEDGTISLEYECMKREGMISHDRFVLRDTGVGMSQDFIQNKIFKPFSQERNAVTGQYAGSGLGLSIVKKLVELMGGTIEVESELGAGTTFTLYLDFERVDPDEVIHEEASETQQQNDICQALAGRRILLAEDHPLNAEIARKLLQRVGCHVTWAQDGLECLDLFVESAEQPYDIILMDIRMPRMGGLEAAQAIRASHQPDAKTIPIIAMTANAYEEDRRLSKQAGMNAHLAKPIEPKKLYETMAAYLPR